MKTVSKLPAKFSLGEICIDENGGWWVQWYGEHAGQGGMEFCYGNMGSDNLPQLLKIVGKDMVKHKERYLKQVKAKVDAAEQSKRAVPPSDPK